MGNGPVTESREERKRRKRREASARWRAKQPLERRQALARAQNTKRKKKFSEMTPEEKRRRLEACTRWRCKTPSHVLLRHARQRAKQIGVLCSITADDVNIPAVCPVLGIPLSRGAGKLHDGSPTLDRLIPEAGYVSGNVSVISHRANRIKNDATLAELEAVVRWMRSR